MNLTLDDQKLLADYHRLPPEGAKELLEFAAFLVKKYHSSSEDATATQNQCSLGRKADPRPEADTDPFFTE